MIEEQPPIDKSINALVPISGSSRALATPEGASRFLGELQTSLDVQLDTFVNVQSAGERVDEFQLNVLRDSALSMAQQSEKAGDMESALQNYRLYLRSNFEVKKLSDSFLGNRDNELRQAVQFVQEHDPGFFDSIKLDEGAKEKYGIAKKLEEDAAIPEHKPAINYEGAQDAEQQMKAITSCIDSSRLFLKINKPDTAIAVLETLQAYHDEFTGSLVVKRAISRAILAIEIEVATYVSHSGKKVERIPESASSSSSSDMIIDQQ